jgi:hypothetical protein
MSERVKHIDSGISSAVEEDDMSDASCSHFAVPEQSGVYIGHNKTISSMSRRKLKKEERFQRRFCRHFDHFYIFHLFPD